MFTVTYFHVQETMISQSCTMKDQEMLPAHLVMGTAMTYVWKDTVQPILPKHKHRRDTLLYRYVSVVKVENRVSTFQA